MSSAEKTRVSHTIKTSGKDINFGITLNRHCKFADRGLLNKRDTLTLHPRAVNWFIWPMSTNSKHRIFIPGNLTRQSNRTFSTSESFPMSYEPFNKAKHVQTIGANSFSWQSSFESTLYHLISSFERTLYHFRNRQLKRFTKVDLVVTCQNTVPLEGSF